MGRTAIGGWKGIDRNPLTSGLCFNLFGRE